MPDYDPTEPCFISHSAEDLNRPRVTDLKARGADVLCWTIPSEKAETKARKIADNVTFEGYYPQLILDPEGARATSVKNCRVPR
jgi:hypothetical protein